MLVPVSVSVPVSILVRAPPLTTPLRVSVSSILVSTVPVPVMATELARARVPALVSSVVPSAIASDDDAPVPSAVLLPTLIVPAVRVVPPV